MQDATCNVCRTQLSAGEQVEEASVRSNVRRFRSERFTIWRCPRCRSIHARDAVDLAHYYGAYPTFAKEVEWRLHPAYTKLLRRLTVSGLRPEHRILDYGCGSGAFLRFLQSKGYDAVGYDAYAEEFRNPSLLSQRYDCVVSQDVIEHVEEPLELLSEYDRLTTPGGLISIGTPDAAAIRLGDPESYVHTLHAPYHRHILASDALKQAAERLGWQLSQYYSTMYSATFVPTQNQRFGLHYLRCHDDCLDLLCEPARFDSWRFWSPLTVFYAFFGRFMDRHTDVQFVFRTRPVPALERS